MKFFIASPWKNKEEVNFLSEELKKNGHSVYSFLESGANLLSGKPIDEEMEIFRVALANWKNDVRISHIFNSEMQGLKDCDVFVLLMPAGFSAHLEAGAAYGMGKKLVLVGPIAKPEVVYLIFDNIYIDISSFLNDLKNISK